MIQWKRGNLKVVLGDDGSDDIGFVHDSVNRGINRGATRSQLRLGFHLVT